MYETLYTLSLKYSSFHIYLYIWYYILCFSFVCMLLSEKQKIDSGFFLFEAEQRAKKEKRIKKQAIRNQKLSSEGIITIPSSSKTSVTEKKAV